MKTTKLLKKYSILLILALTVSCAKKITSATENTEEVLLVKDGWQINPLDKGVVHYELPKQFLKDFNSFQNVNVLAINPLISDYEIVFKDITPRDSISTVANNMEKAIFAINGTYYEKKANNGNSTSYFKSNNVLIDSVQVPSGSLFAWKHEGAFYKKGKDFGIVRGNNKVYTYLEAQNIMSGSPILIENFYPSGAYFVRDYVSDLTTLPYENPDRHQGVRHPRTAVAITDNGTILFVAVDGRNTKAAGMSAKELTLFLKKYFNPKDALNIDGGGSTTFWLKNDNRSDTGVINFPTDNKKSDHYGQRAVRNGFVILKNN
ncbi:phosphodiester glycosidase family protein [Flavobacterium agricola]|uniref:Phosphodiester glycosidase family protein n=1 Tax=Flavobacterium agricola TaxID=2870839 RepID=A0ABY6M4C3_9FLAO|nr:phosphodiester glycosidase family protein [Flavobacterium agricola]UYW02458.1 phosphodiester glycosidase family protein [Flavobacterium agricola]